MYVLKYVSVSILPKDFECFDHARVLPKSHELSIGIKVSTTRKLELSSMIGCRVFTSWVLPTFQCDFVKALWELCSHFAGLSTSQWEVFQKKHPLILLIPPAYCAIVKCNLLMYRILHYIYENFKNYQSLMGSSWILFDSRTSSVSNLDAIWRSLFQVAALIHWHGICYLSKFGIEDKDAHPYNVVRIFLTSMRWGSSIAVLIVQSSSCIAMSLHFLRRIRKHSQFCSSIAFEFFLHDWHGFPSFSVTMQIWN